MAGRTNTDRIEDIGKQVIVLTRDVEHLRAVLRDQSDAVRRDQIDNRNETQALRSLVGELQQRVAGLERSDPGQIPVILQRIHHTEKLLDEGRTRRWQVWIAVFGAVLSATVALIIALVKR
jgi:hypothetical protein